MEITKPIPSFRDRSESIKNLAGALIKFQSRMPGIAKDSTNPFFKSKYVSLGSLQEAIKPVLVEAGLCYVQLLEGTRTVTTMLIHAESGEFIQSSVSMKPEKDTPQGVGSAITYQKRYALAALLGINTDYDDDGNSASSSR